jgi:hypothetical protein
MHIYLVNYVTTRTYLVHYLYLFSHQMCHYKYFFGLLCRYLAKYNTLVDKNLEVTINPCKEYRDYFIRSTSARVLI